VKPKAIILCGGPASAPARKHHVDFWKFLIGETISNFGSSFTLFALPLLIYQLTGSAINLALSTAANFLPYLAFGLLIGALGDRVNRKRMMILADFGNAAVIGSIPLLAALGFMADRVFFVAWMYIVGFLSSTLGIFFRSGQFAAIPSLVKQDALVTANGRIQASFQAAQVAGPLLAGVLLLVMPLPMLMLVDALSFLVSALTLSLMTTSFNQGEKRIKTSIRQDVLEGLRYVWHHPVLRAISLLTPLVNLVGSTLLTQIALFATVRYHATPSQVGLFYSAASLGMVLLALVAGPLRKRWPFSTVALVALFAYGGLIVGLALTPWYLLAVLLWALGQGATMLFNVNTQSLRQALVPNELLGRVLSVSQVLAYASIPLGALGGGIMLEQVGVAQVGVVYAVIGILICFVAFVFSRTALGNAERYLSTSAAQGAPRQHAPDWQPAFRALVAGMRTTVPFALGMIAPLVIYGTTALQAGLSPLAAQAMMLLVFSGAVLPAVQAIQAGTPLLLVGLLIVVLNLRHLLYSARLAPKLRRLPLTRRLVASYLLTDESFGAEERRALMGIYDWQWWWFLVGAGLTMWLTAQGATALGVVLGTQIPIWDGMSFLPTLAFIGLAVLSLKGRASVVVALSAGGAALYLSPMPLGLGLLVTVGIGVATGVIAEHLHRQPKLAWVKEGKQ